LLSKLSFSEPRVTLMNLTYLTTSPSSPEGGLTSGTQSLPSTQGNGSSLPGPQLLEEETGNFTDGVYTNRQLSGDEILYKYHGERNRLGDSYNYVTNKLYANETDLRNGLGILDQWGVNIDRVTTFKPQKNTWISEGTAAPQVGYIDEFRPGGDYQGVINVNNLPNSTIIRTDFLPKEFMK
jgi:hypothetical protein